MRKDKIKYCLDNGIEMEYFNKDVNRVKRINNIGDQILVSYDGNKIYVGNANSQEILGFDEIYELGELNNAKRFNIR